MLVAVALPCRSGFPNHHSTNILVHGMIQGSVRTMNKNVPAIPRRTALSWRDQQWQTKETSRSDIEIPWMSRSGDISEHITCANQAPMVSRSVPRLPSRFTPGYHGFHRPLRSEKNLTGNRQMAKKKWKPPKRSPNRAFRSRPKSYSPPELPDRRAIEGVMKGFLGEMLGGPAAGTPLAWIPMEEERPNENASALPENSNIFALSAPWSLCGSKSYRGVSREVSRSIVYSAFVVQLSFRPGKIGIRRS